MGFEFFAFFFSAWPGMDFGGPLGKGLGRGNASVL